MWCAGEGLVVYWCGEMTDSVILRRAVSFNTGLGFIKRITNYGKKGSKR